MWVSLCLGGVLLLAALSSLAAPPPSPLTLTTARGGGEEEEGVRGKKGRGRENEWITEWIALCVRPCSLVVGLGYADVLCSDCSLCRPTWIYIFTQGVFVTHPFGFFLHSKSLCFLSFFFSSLFAVSMTAFLNLLPQMWITLLNGVHQIECTRLYKYLFPPSLCAFYSWIEICSGVRGSFRKYLFSTPLPATSAFSSSTVSPLRPVFCPSKCSCLSHSPPWGQARTHLSPNRTETVSAGACVESVQAWRR